MKRLTSALALAALTLVLTAGAVTAGNPPPPQTVESWPFAAPYGSFVESMAAGPDGYVYVSRTAWGDASNTAVIERFRPGGGPITTVAGPFDTAGGLALGLVFDGPQLYVAVATFSDVDLPGVFRVETTGKLRRVLTLPPGSFPNGLAFHDRYLYVTDASLGAVWRVQPKGAAQVQTEPWLQDPLLAPVKDLGPDGIAYRGDEMYLTQYDRGLILRAHVSADGTAAPLAVFAQDDALVTADGIAFDARGSLWVAVNGLRKSDSGRLVVVSGDGNVTVVADDPPWLAYPTQPVFVSQSTMLVANGSYYEGTPNVVSLGGR
jgi:hypothetical protein